VAFEPAFDQPFPAAGLAAGQSARINVTYAPTTAGPDRDRLIIESSDEADPEFSIDLGGSVKNPPPCDLLFGASRLYFDGVVAGTVSTTSIEITTVPSSACHVSRAEMAVGSSPAFSVTLTQGVDGPSSQKLEIQFAPTVVGATYEGTLNVSFDNPNSPELAFPLTALGF